MKKLAIVVLVVIGIALLVHTFSHQTVPTSDLTQVEPVVIGMTMALSAYVLDASNPASCTISGFASFIASTTPAWSNMFSEFSCDLKVIDTDAIFVIQDKPPTKLLFEDGTWSSKLDAPHWRVPNLPRLPFPIASGGAVK